MGRRKRAVARICKGYFQTYQNERNMDVQWMWWKQQKRHNLGSELFF